VDGWQLHNRHDLGEAEMNHKYGFHVNRTGDDVLDAIGRLRPLVLKSVEHDVGFWREVRTILLKQDGFEPIAMNWATGNMLGEDFIKYLAGSLETYTYLGFHEYDWPTMWRIHWQNIMEKDEGGMWLALRYRRVMDEVRKVYGDKHTVIITECGMTQGVTGGEDVGPWHIPTISPEQVDAIKGVMRLLREDPRFEVKIDIDRIGMDQPIPEEIYWESLVWYNDELMMDDYMMAALLFVVGAIAPWESFEHLGGIMDRLESFQKG
jgi:hypothetical protein